MIQRDIVYFGRSVVTACDARCDKAWGIADRPRVQLDPHDEDDYEYLSDGELGEAPDDPGTYEGGHGKPSCYDEPLEHRLNKWCVRACERSVIRPRGVPIDLPDFSTRRSNRREP